MIIAKKYQDALPRIKKNVQLSYEYFKPNYQRFNEFRRFVFVTSLSDDDISLLKTLGKPQIEFNILEAYISRLRGEFAKQEPSIEVFANYEQQVDPQILEVVEGFIRQIECDARKDGTAYAIYTDMLTGGFSVAKVTTDYSNDKSFDQVIKWERAFDPTLCGFDPLAQLPNKSDGQYAFEIFPKTKEEFQDEYPDMDISQVKFSRNQEGFNWAYRNERSDILLICDYYCKKIRKTKLVKLASGHTITADQHQELLDNWNKNNYIEQPPGIVDERTSNVPVICRYRFIENQVIEYVETDFKYFPLVFFDGNSTTTRNDINSESQQFTRPYVYHAKGAQKLKNLAGQCAANELENMVMHKFKVPKEGIPPEYADAYTNMQVPNTLIYNAFKNNDPNVPLPPPQEIARVPEPPIIMNTFSGADQVTQSILGSYDASLGINDNQLSGIAIIEAATQSNAAAMTYVIGYMQGLNHVARIIIDLIPKYYLAPRNISIIAKTGKRVHIPINNGQYDMKYPENSLGVRVEAGVNFQIQKSRNLQLLISVAQAMPGFAEFMQSMGLPIIIKNLEIYGADQLEPLADQFMKQQQQQQQMAMQQQQQQMQQNPMMIKAQAAMAKVQQQQQQDQINAQLKAAEIAQMQQSNDNERNRLVLDAYQANQENMIQLDKHETEKAKAAVDLAVNAADMVHRHNTEISGMAHDQMMDHAELSHKVAQTVLQHQQHEVSETPKEELDEH
jgi:hypothetical protein